jgi:hypothetical protein
VQGLSPEELQLIAYFGVLKVSGAAFNSFDLRGFPLWQAETMAIVSAKNGTPSDKIIQHFIK